MGTTVEVFLYASDPAAAATLFDAAFEEIERVEEALSSYRPSSEISRINAGAGQATVVTDPEVFGLIRRALDYSRRTDGAFDITVGALVRAWGFFRDEGRYPSPDELAAARSRTGWKHMALDPTTRGIRFTAPGIELDLGGIGKGFALDCAARVLQRHGVTAALLGAGQSSYYAIATPPQARGWRIVVPNPYDPDHQLSTVWLRDGALATSGTYAKFFELDGRRYSHLIDPRTGMPQEHTVQVTVTATTAAESDALSTALSVTGTAGATALIGDDTAALLVVGDTRAGNVVGIRWTSTTAAERFESHRVRDEGWDR